MNTVHSKASTLSTVMRALNFYSKMSFFSVVSNTNSILFTVMEAETDISTPEQIKPKTICMGR